MKRIAILNVLLISSLNHLPPAHGGIIVNEVAYAGSNDQCDGSDWIELYNPAQEPTNLENYTLHDDKGHEDDEAKIFQNETLAAGEYKVLCKGVDFEFGIGSSDAVTLLDGEGNVVSSSGVLPGTGGDGQTYAFFNGEYKYTMTATPGAENVYTTMQEVLDEQNELGKDFFRLNDDGTERTSSPFGTVVDLYVDMEPSSLQEIKEHAGHEKYVPFTQVRVVSGDNTTLTVGGRIRTRGQSTLYIPACFGKNVPYRLNFDNHLFGLETAYLRNHAFDQSYMREYATHRLNARFGLPFLRTRTVRLYLNDEYTGLYTMMEAPNQAYVMQRSFGPFDPAQTALFKFKTFLTECPYTDEEALAKAEERATPDPYYFDRGDHRDDIPVLGNIEECGGFLFGQIMKIQDDLIKGYVEHDRDCSVAMVKMGRIDRDFGPKALEDAMISFLQSNIFEPTDPDLKNAVDANQWLKNFASYAVMLNFDSPIININNWYLATTAGGAGDWRIVQYDFNMASTRIPPDHICSFQCGPRLIYWPILRPTCGAVEDHPLVGPILDDEESRNIYLGYVEEFVELLSPAFFREMRDHGESIKQFVVDDPLNNLTASQYQDTELSSDFEKYNTEQNPFLQVLRARKVEVQKQLDAIRSGTLPRNGQYDANEICPDWRDSNGENYLQGSTFVSSTACPSDCEEDGQCYNNMMGLCEVDGTMFIDECKILSPSCDACFPYSKCGTSDDDSGVIIKSDRCDDDSYESCIANSHCFDHNSGQCAFDGEILTEECKLALRCKSCFPNSRCGEELFETKDSGSYMLVHGRFQSFVPLIILLASIVAI